MDWEKHETQGDPPSRHSCVSTSGEEVWEKKEEVLRNTRRKKRGICNCAHLKKGGREGSVRKPGRAFPTYLAKRKGSRKKNLAKEKLSIRRKIRGGELAGHGDPPRKSSKKGETGANPWRG